MIRAERLGKKYLLGHKVHRRKGATLRDTISQSLEGLWRNKRDVEPNRSFDGFESEDFWALRDVSFEVKRGDVVGVIGRNGAGKSTLLKVLSRITEPSCGKVEIRGRVASMLEVGTGFHPELTGRENIYLNGAILGMTRSEISRKFDEIVAFAEVARFLDTPVKRYSSGMYVRLAFAVAAHLEPEILIVDEVLAVGDATFQEKCLGKMESVSGDGRTVLFVSHNMSAISQLCKTAFLLQDGALAVSGTTAEVLAAYNSSVQHVLSEGAELLNTGEESWQEARILAASLEHVDGSPATAATSGKPIKVRIIVETRHPIPDLSAVVSIRGPFTGQLIKLASTPDKCRAALANTRIGFECTIGALPLVPGQYLISIGIAHHGERWIREYHDFAFLEVIGTDDPELQMCPFGGGPIATAHQWRAWATA